ncbi:MAG: hypothetical protein KG075_03875 [Alphaproteobacteria bacterium]|nr:hypothetical protein [Alphaproteobacteria bacterium]
MRTQTKSYRINPEDHQPIELAASRIGVSPSEFVRTAALEKAAFVNKGMLVELDQLDLTVKNHEWLFFLIVMLKEFIEQAGHGDILQVAEQKVDKFRSRLRKFEEPKK